MTRDRPVHSAPHLPDATVPGGGPVNGRLVVVPHVSPSDYSGGPAIRWTPAVSRTNVGKVRIGFGDGVVNLGHRYVPIAPVFDPLADSMVPSRDRKGLAA